MTIHVQTVIVGELRLDFWSDRSFCDKSMKVGIKLADELRNIPGGGTTLTDFRFPIKSRWIPRWPPNFRGKLCFDYSLIKQHALYSLMNKSMPINIFSSYLTSTTTLGHIKQNGRQDGCQNPSKMHFMLNLLLFKAL